MPDLKLKYIYYLITCLFVLSVFSSCKTDEIELTGSITGVVTDSYTKEPIRGAQVRNLTVEQTCQTGSDGSYTFRDLKVLAGNKHVIQVMADGYETDQKSILLDTGDDNRLDFALNSSKPVLELSEETLDFEKTYTTHTVSIKNVGLADLVWEANEDMEWLSCSPTSGTVRKGAQVSLEIKVDRSGLKEGPYTASVSISSNGGSKQIVVKMHVEGMSVSVTPTELDFGETVTTYSLKLESNKEVKYFLEPSNSWIIPSKTEGLFIGTEHVTVVVDRTNVSPGKYEGSLTLRVGAAIKTIPVRMTKPTKQAPQVAFYSVGDVTYGSAMFSGAVINVGSSKITRYGFCWSEEKIPDINTWFKCDFGDLQEAGNMPAYEASNLKPSTRYYVCSYAENSEGLSYSDVAEFTTKALPSAPAIETGTISKITHNSATVSGNVLNIGNDTGITDHGHVWSTSPAPTVDNLKTSLGKKIQAGVFSSELKGLSPNVTYYIRAYAVNSIGMSYGEEKTFTTLPDEMKISTSSVESITHNCATLGGQITYDGGNVVAERGVCWSESKNPTVDGSHQMSLDQGDKFSVRVETLEPLTSYYYRAYVIAETGTVYYGNDVFFTTTHEIFVPKTSAVTVSSVQTKSATVSSSIADDGKGSVSDKGFVYSKSINPTVNDFKVSCATQGEDFSATLTDLEDNTTYYVRSYAVNEAGTGYGEETFFTTLEIKVPSLSSTEVSSVTYNSATFSANVIDLNNGSLKDAGFVYSSVSSEPDLNASRISCGYSAMLLTTTATSLTANTKYYVRAYATNEKGTAYGEIQTFTTNEAPQPPVVKTGDVSEITCASAVVAGEIAKLGVDEGVTQYGHVWSLSSAPTTSDFKTEKGKSSDTSIYNSALNDLLPNRTYYVRAYAENKLGTAYGNEVTFTTLPDVMTLTTSAASDVTHNAATLGGTVTYYGGNAVKEYGVCWSESPDPVITGAHKSAPVDGDTFTVRAEGLKEKTAYHYRSYVVSEFDEVYYGPDKTFTTTHEIFIPKVSDISVSDLKVTGAKVTANVTSDGEGNVSDAGFIWSQSEDVLVSGTKISLGAMSSALSYVFESLTENTTYYVCAYVVNEAGTGYSPVTSFKTLEILLPEVSEVTVVSCTHRSATFSADVRSLNHGTMLDAGFVYSDSPEPTLDDNVVRSASADMHLSGKATPLEPLTKYYVRAFVTNEKGTVYSTQTEFTTKEKSDGSDFDMGGFEGEDNDWN